MNGDANGTTSRFGDLTCVQIVELITDYLEGALEESLSLRVEEHLADCPPCREYVEQMRATVEATGRLSEADVPAATMDALMDAFRDGNRDL